MTIYILAKMITDDKKIAVFRPEGGAPIKEIASPGLNPWNIRHMNHSNLLVVTDGLHCESD